MTLAELMAVSRERELTEAEQRRVVHLANVARWRDKNRAAINARARVRRKRNCSKSDVARMRSRDDAGRFLPQCLSTIAVGWTIGDTAGSGA